MKENNSDNYDAWYNSHHTETCQVGPKLTREHVISDIARRMQVWLDAHGEKLLKEGITDIDPGYLVYELPIPVTRKTLEIWIDRLTNG